MRSDFGRSANGSWWNEHREAKFREIAADKTRSTREMGEILGCSRNAIISKARRLGIELTHPSYPTPARKEPKRPRASSRVVGTIPLTGPEPVEIKPEPSTRTWIRFVKMRPWSCKWPVLGEPGPDMMCCGARRVDDKPYCEHHCEIAFRGYE